MKMEEDNDQTKPAPTTPARLVMMPLSSSPLIATEANNDPTKSEIHDFALEEGHHTASSSPFDSDPEDDALKSGVESPSNRKLASFLSPVMEQPEELFNHEKNSKTTPAINNPANTNLTADAKASMESDLIQLENEIAANTDQEDEHEVSLETGSHENSTLLDDNTVLDIESHDQLTPLVPRSKQEEPDLIDFTTSGVTVTEEEMGASSESDEEAQKARAEAELLDSDDEEDTGVVAGEDQSRAAQELPEAADDAYGEMSELAIIMEDEEELEAGSWSENKTQSVRAEAKLLDSNNEEDASVVEDNEKLQAAHELLTQSAHAAYGEMSELAVIMEEEEPAPCPAHPSYANLSALMLEGIETEQRRQDQERQHNDIAPLSKSNSNNSHKEAEQIDSAVGDDKSHGSFESGVNVADTKHNEVEESPVKTSAYQDEEATTSRQFVLLSAKDKNSLRTGSTTLHFEENEYSEHEDLQSCVAAITTPFIKDEGATTAKVDSNGQTPEIEQDD